MAPALRPSTVTDTEALAQIHAQTWQETYTGIIPAALLAKIGSVEGRRRARDYLFANKHPACGHFLVETGDGKLIGFGDCGPSHEVIPFAPAEIYTLYILKAYQKQGWGKVLLRTMFDHLAKHGLTKVALNTHHLSQQAKEFYQHCGGQEVATIPRDDWAETVYVWPQTQPTAPMPHKEQT